MIVLTDEQRVDVLAEVNLKSGLSKDIAVVQAAMRSASSKFNIKFSVSKKGTYHETWILKTSYNNAEEVRRYLTDYCGVLVTVSNGVVKFPAGWEKK